MLVAVPGRFPSATPATKVYDVPRANRLTRTTLEVPGAVARREKSRMSTFDSTKTELGRLLDEVIAGRIQLPDFQRGWVWDDEHIRSLLVSIARSFPIGAVMLLETGGDARFQVRPVEGVSLAADIHAERLILDGQQRLTSLIQVLKLQTPVATQDEKKRQINRYYYFDIDKALDGSASLEESVLAVSEDRIQRTNFGRDIELDLSSTTKEYDAFCFPCNQVFDANQWMYGLMQHRQERVQRFMQFSQRVLEPFRHYLSPSHRIEEGNVERSGMSCLRKGKHWWCPPVSF